MKLQQKLEAQITEAYQDLNTKLMGELLTEWHKEVFPEYTGYHLCAPIFFREENQDTIAYADFSRLTDDNSGYEHSVIAVWPNQIFQHGYVKEGDKFYDAYFKRLNEPY